MEHNSDAARCQACGKPASVHVTEVRGTRKRQKHLCDEHAQAAGLPIGTPEQSAAALATVLRRQQNFIRRHGRVPAAGEEQQEDKPTLNYAASPQDRWRIARAAVHIAVLVDVVLAAIFAITRPIQLRQADSYNNVWTTISTSAYLGAVALWAITFVAAVILLVLRRRLSVLVYVWLIVAGIIVAIEIVQMIRFVFLFIGPQGESLDNTGIRITYYVR